jgi:hypothetical protein
MININLCSTRLLIKSLIVVLLFVAGNTSAFPLENNQSPYEEHQSSNKKMHHMDTSQHSTTDNHSCCDNMASLENICDMQNPCDAASHCGQVSYHLDGHILMNTGFTLLNQATAPPSFRLNHTELHMPPELRPPKV